MREKHEYIKIIDKLTEENIKLKKIIEDYEKKRIGLTSFFFLIIFKFEFAFLDFEISETAKALKRAYNNEIFVNNLQKTKANLNTKLTFFE